MSLQVINNHPQIKPFLKENRGLLVVSGGGGSGKSFAVKEIVEAHKAQFERNNVYNVTDVDLKPIPDDLGSAGLRRIDTVLRTEPSLFLFSEICSGELWFLVTELVGLGFSVVVSCHGHDADAVLQRAAILMANDPPPKNPWEGKQRRALIKSLLEQVSTTTPFLVVQLTQDMSTAAQPQSALQ